MYFSAKLYLPYQTISEINHILLSQCFKGELSRRAI